MSAPSRSPALFVRGRRRATIGLIGLVTLVAFEAIAVSTAMPVTVRDLGAESAYAWAFTSFGMTFLVGTVIAGELCDARGPFRPLVGGLVSFVAGLVVAGLAPTMPVLVLGRGLQGFGAGGILVAMYVIVARAYPEDVRPKVFAAMAAAWIVPAMVGPIVAGYFADQLSWRLVYLTIPGLVVAAAWAVWRTARAVDGPPADPVPARPHRKWLAVAAAVGFAALQQAGVAGGRWSLVLLPIALVLLVPTIPRLLPAGTLRLRRGLPATIAMRGLLAGPFTVVDSFIPLMLVSQRGLSTTAAGFALVGGTFGWAAGSWAQGRRAGGAGSHRTQLVRAGSALTAIGVAGVCAAIYAPMPGLVVGVAWSVAGAGMGLALASINVVALELSPVAEQGATSAGIQVSDSVAAVVLTSVAGAVYATFRSGDGQDAEVFLAIFGIQLAVALVAVAVAGRMRPRATLPGSPAGPGVEVLSGAAAGQRRPGERR